MGAAVGGFTENPKRGGLPGGGGRRGRGRLGGEAPFTVKKRPLFGENASLNPPKTAHPEKIGMHYFGVPSSGFFSQIFGRENQIH